MVRQRARWPEDPSQHRFQWAAFTEYYPFLVRRDSGYPGAPQKTTESRYRETVRSQPRSLQFAYRDIGGRYNVMSPGVPVGRIYITFLFRFSAKALEFKELQIWQSLCSLNDVRWQIEGAHALGTPGNKLCTVYNLLWVVSATIHTQGVAPGDNRMGNFVVIFWEVKLELASNPYRG